MLSTQGVDLIVKTTTATTISATAASDHRHQRPLYNISNSNNHPHEHSYSHKFNRTDNQLSSYHQIPENFETYSDLNHTATDERFQQEDLLIEQEESLFIPCTDTLEFDDLEKTMSNSTQVSAPPVQFLQSNTFGGLVMSGPGSNVVGQVNEAIMDHHHHGLSHHHQLWGHSVRFFWLLLDMNFILINF